LQQVRCHNIDSVDVVLPLGVFCAVIGPSGSGKSSLISDALYPALCHELKLASPVRAEGTIHRILGAHHIENVLLLDQSPVQRSRRSIPATWIGVFDDIRILLAETHEGKKRNYSRAMFSFNASSGGRCPVCEGRGVVTVAMQFLADIETVCEECHGRRFRPEVIEIRYRDRSVSDILDMTADEAFTFFNGHHRIQQRLNAVRQSGLGYLRLGQPLSTVSGGEAQRLRIAAMLAGVPLTDGDTAAKNRQASQLTRSGRTLFLLDEPSSGLHLQDIDRLLNCIDFLLQMGHSVIVIDHDEFLTSRADWHIEMGPGAGKLGGRIVRSERN
jgi:excinuclease ABC subunit A